MQQNHALVSINLLTLNGEKYIRPCLESALNQSYSKTEIIIIDNNSQDNTKKEIEKFRNNSKIKKIIFNKEQIGFAAGHNQAIRQSNGDFVLCLNQDIVLDKDFIYFAIKTMQKYEKIAAIQGKIQRFNANGSFSKKIDTTGMMILKNRRIINRGQGEIDQGQFEQEDKIFGADGACPIYRRKALEDVALFCHPEQSEGSRGRSETTTRVARIASLPRDSSPAAQNDKREYFDEDFFAYKEDVDLAWRLLLNDWQAVYQPKAMAWHWRGSGDSAVRTPWGIIKERRKLTNFSKKLAFQNQRLMQIKNEYPWLFIKHLPWIIPKELGAWAYVLCFEKYTWSAIKDLFKKAPLAWRKKKIIMANKKVKAKKIKRWFR